MHVELGCRPSHLVEQEGELLLHLQQPLSRERLRVGVGLQVEEAQLGGEVRIVDPLEDLQRARRRVVAAIDQEELLLGADAHHAALEGACLQHLLERAEIREHRAHEPSAALALLLFIIRGADTLTLSPANFPQPSPTV